jgi:hypothetical protein
VQGQRSLHELDVLHKPDEIIGEDLRCRLRPDTTGIESRWVDMPSLHEAEHLPRLAALDQSFPIKRACERIERAHDIGDRSIAMDIRVRREGFFRLCKDTGIGFLDHLLAEVHTYQIVLKQAVIEHVLGGFAEIDDPFRDWRRNNAVRHVLRINRASRVIIATNSTDSAGDEVRVSRVLPFHKDAVAAEDR